MLPAAKSHRFSLADVLPNCLDALAGRTGRLGLAPVTHAVVLLADGLGRAALEAHRGHARTLASRLDADPAISAGFPTTTASALATLTTGAAPGQHGMVGYRVLDPEHDEVVNQLTGLDDARTRRSWQRSPTLFETAAAAGRPRRRDRVAAAPRVGLHRARCCAAPQYHGAVDVAERFARARHELAAPGPDARLPLRLRARRRGARARARLGALDRRARGARCRRRHASSPRSARGRGCSSTADHGMVDVPDAAQVIVPPELLEGVRHVAGEPRCLQLHLEPGVDPDAVAAPLEGSRGRARLGRDPRRGDRRRLVRSGRPGRPAAHRRRAGRGAQALRVLRRSRRHRAPHDRPARLAHARRDRDPAAAVRRVRRLTSSLTGAQSSSVRAPKTISSQLGIEARPLRPPRVRCWSARCRSIRPTACPPSPSAPRPARPSARRSAARRRSTGARRSGPRARGPSGRARPGGGAAPRAGRRSDSWPCGAGCRRSARRRRVGGADASVDDGLEQRAGLAAVGRRVNAPLSKRLDSWSSAATARRRGTRFWGSSPCCESETASGFRGESADFLGSKRPAGVAVDLVGDEGQLDDPGAALLLPARPALVERARRRRGGGG